MALRRPKPVIELTKHGFVVRLDPDELGLIRHLLAELRGLVQSDDPATEPIRRRLFPPAYHLVEHSEQEAEYQRLMRDDLVASRLAALDQLDEVLAPTDGIVLDEAGMNAFLQSLNGVRLVLGTLIDVGESDDLDDLPPDHPMLAEHHLYAFLSWLLEVGVQAISGQRAR